MRVTTAIVIAPFFLAAAPISALADCSADLANVERAERASTVEETEGLARALDSSIACETWEKRKAKGLLSAKLVTEAKKIDPAVKDARAAAMIEKAARLDADWHALQFQGRIRRSTGRYLEAAQSFQEAINLIAYSDDEAKSSPPPANAWKNEASKPERANLAIEADEAKHLAATGPNGTLVSSSDRDGNPGGVFSAAVDRGAVGIRVPAPILFEFNSANLTRIGADAAHEMVDVLKGRSPKSITIIGHTDHVGSDAYNLDLSKRRAATVAAFLKDKGTTARIVSVGKGFSKPWKLSEGATYSQAQIDELNRRVEFDWN
jgi:outer membrane protein OmpA-like peptidoglycan-associated protein